MTRPGRKPREDRGAISQDVLKAAREKRKGAGENKLKMAVDPNAYQGFKLRWVNDSDEGVRLKRFLDMGYFFCLDSGSVQVGEDGDGNESTDSRVTKVVGTIEGRPLTAYLMATPEEVWKEAQAEKQKEIDEIDQQIREGNPSGKTGGKDFYRKESHKYQP